MKSIDIVKNRLIDKIMVSDNEPLLNAIENIFNSTQNKEALTLDSQQIEMLSMSEKDILRGTITSDSELRNEDSKWMD